jgi:glycosyltransferase involved in cell wall biosynthesis
MNQTYKKLEIIINDDCSKDNTLDVARSLQKEDSRIKIYKNETNLGFNKNFESSLKYAAGELISLCDQDDIWVLDKIERQYNLLKKENSSLVYCNANLIDADGKDLEKNLFEQLHVTPISGDTQLGLIYDNCISGNTLMFKKSLLDKIYPIPEKVFFDRWIGFVASYDGPVSVIKESLIYYRQHGGNVTDVLREKKKKKTLKMRIEKRQAAFEIKVEQFEEFLAFFVISNFLIWESATKDILTRKDKDIITGDMSRMGYLPKLNYKRKNINDLPKKHMNFTGLNKNIDMITIGDSFSNGMAGGLNRFYQDYLASYTGMDILNIQQIPGTRNYLETIIMLYNNGALEKAGVKYILIESTQRKVVTRFSILIDYEANLRDNNILKTYFKKVDNKAFGLPEVNFINNGNYKYLLYSFLYNFSPNAFISKVYKVKLNELLFSIGKGNDLLFYKSDLSAIPKNKKENIVKVNDELNKVAELLGRVGIKLVFMPAVAKYDLYRDYIKDNTDFPKDPFFDILRGLEKKYIFIDSKKILSKELKRGVKDIFYIDDTHWSYKASDIISKDITQKLNK